MVAALLQEGPQVRTPRTREALVACVQAAVDEGRTVRAMGAGWGLGNAHFADDVSIHCGGLRQVLPIAREELREPRAWPRLLRFEAGATFDQLEAHLAPQGLTLPQRPGFGALSFVGVASVGGHGSGFAIPPINEDIVSLELVIVDGQRRARVVRVEPTQGLTDPQVWAAQHPSVELLQDDALFHAARCAQGHLGVISQVTIRTRPAFWLEEARTLGRWSSLWPHVRDELLPAADVHSVHVWLNPYLPDPSAVVTRLTTTSETRRSGQRGFAVRLGGANPATSLVRQLVTRVPQLTPILMEPALRGACAGRVVLPAAEALDFGPPNEIPVVASNFAVAAEQVGLVVPALCAHLQHLAHEGLWATTPLGLRWAAASRDFLAPQYGRQSAMLEVPVLEGTPRTRELLQRVGAFLIDTFGARPHWGQQQSLTPGQFRALYPAAPAFRAVLARLNPLQVFTGPLTRQLELDHA